MRWECAACGGVIRRIEAPRVCPCCGIGGQCYPAGTGFLPGPAGPEGFREAWLERGMARGWYRPGPERARAGLS